MNKYIGYIFLLLLAVSCKTKPDPEPVVETPVFTAVGTIGGQALNLQAGNDDVQLRADFETTPDSIYYFTATYEDGAGNDLLKFGFRDYKTRAAGEAVDIQNVITTGEGYFVDTVTTTSTVYRASFINSSTSGLTYNWSFGDGATASTSAIGETIHLYENTGAYSVSLATAGGCSSSISNSYDIQENGCLTDFTYNYVPDSLGGYFSATAAPISGAGGYTYTWQIDSATYQGDSIGVFLFNSGVVQVTLTQTDASGCTVTIRKNIDVHDAFTPPQSCLANFHLAGVEKVLLNAEQYFNNIYLEWTDPSGTVFTTRDYPQQSGQINILSTEMYDDNANGDPTLKVELTISATLYDDAGNSVEAQNVNATIAVAYPR